MPFVMSKMKDLNIFISLVTRHTRKVWFKFVSRRTILTFIKGGNDYEIFIDPRTIGHSVTNPEHTGTILTELFLS